MKRAFLALLLLLAGLILAPGAHAACPGTDCVALSSGYLQTSGNQITDGLGTTQRLACTQYRGGSTSASVDMPLIRSAGFNCVRISWRDAFQVTPPGFNDCSGNTRMDACVLAATNAGLKVIFDHHGNELPSTATSQCWGQQANGLWYDLNGPAPYNITQNQDGCGDTGTVTYATFKSNTVAIATRYASNTTVIGMDLHNEPLTYGVNVNVQANWGGGTGTGNFTVSNGQVIGPDGNPFVAIGMNVLDDVMANVTTTNWQNLFPKANIVRLAVGGDCLTGVGGYTCAQSNTAIQTFVNAFTAKNIVVMIESHYTGQPNANVINATGEYNWYKALATLFNGNAYVWFESGNELGRTGLTAEHANVYKAVRDAGNPTIVVFTSATGNDWDQGGVPDGPASTYQPFSNTIWGQHFYNWMPCGQLTWPGLNGTTGCNDQNAVNGWLIQNINDAFGYVTTATGKMPTLISEAGFNDYANVCGGNGGPGTGTLNNSFKCGSGQSMTAALNHLNAQHVGGVGWLWHYTCCSWQTDFVNASTENSLFSPYGGFVQSMIAAQSPGPVTGSAGGAGADIRLMCSDVGAAVNTANPGVLIICEGPITNKATLFSGAANQTTLTGDLSIAGSQPVTGVPANKIVYSVHDYPCNLSASCPDSGSATTATRNASWGYLESGNTAPVFIGEMGCSCDNTNGALADDTAWASAIVSYMNGGQGPAGGPTFTGIAQPVSWSWWSWGNQAGENPNGTLNADGSLKTGQQGVWSQLLMKPLGGGGGTTRQTTWNPSDTDANMLLSNNNLTATSNTLTGPTSTRSTTSYSAGKVCAEISADTITSDWDAGLANASYVLTAVNGLGGDANGVGIDPNSGGGLQGIFYNNAVLSSGGVSSANGEKVTICQDFGAQLFWATTSAMRGAGNAWNNSPTANPATGTGGLSTSGLTCPCFLIFNEINQIGVATLNTRGPFAVATPSGFQAWDVAAVTSKPSLIINLGANDNLPRPANDDLWIRLASNMEPGQ